MKAYYWSPYPLQRGFFLLPERDRTWYYNQYRFFGFEKPDPMPNGLVEYETTDHPAVGHLARFNAERDCFEHRIGFDSTPDEHNPFGKLVWGRPEWSIPVDIPPQAA